MKTLTTVTVDHVRGGTLLRITRAEPPFVGKTVTAWLPPSSGWQIDHDRCGPVWRLMLSAPLVGCVTLSDHDTAEEAATAADALAHQLLGVPPLGDPDCGPVDCDDSTARVSPEDDGDADMEPTPKRPSEIEVLEAVSEHRGGDGWATTDEIFAELECITVQDQLCVEHVVRGLEMAGLVEVQRNGIHMLDVGLTSRGERELGVAQTREV